MKTVVLGLGNSLLRDEGVGVVATNALRAQHGALLDRRGDGPLPRQLAAAQRA